MSAVSTSLARPLVANLEWLKWAGVVAMFADHFCVYALQRDVPAAEWVGSLAFPLFVAAFAAGLANASRADQRRALARLIAWAAIAQVSVATVRTVPIGTVLFTFLLGLVLHMALTSLRALPIRFAGACIAIVLSMGTEYMTVGVILVAAAIAIAQRRINPWVPGVVLAVSLVLLQPFNGNHGALLAVPLIAAIAALPADAPRVRRAFYVVYVAQFPLWRLIREALS